MNLRRAHGGESEGGGFSGAGAGLCDEVFSGEDDGDGGGLDGGWGFVTGGDDAGLDGVAEAEGVESGLDGGRCGGGVGVDFFFHARGLQVVAETEQPHRRIEFKGGLYWFWGDFARSGHKSVGRKMGEFGGSGGCFRAVGNFLTTEAPRG